MSHRRKAIVALAAVAVIAVGALWLWPRNVYRYQGKTVEEWFREINEAFESALEGIPGGQRHARALKAFQEMGTNAMPFLVSRINRDPAPSLLERWANKLPARFRPMSRRRETRGAVMLLEAIQPPRSMLAELLKPALRSQDSRQRDAAAEALLRIRTEGHSVH